MSNPSDKPTPQQTDKKEHPEPAACNFCGRARGVVTLLIRGPHGLGICDECVDLAADIVAKERPPAPTV